MGEIIATPFDIIFKAINREMKVSKRLIVGKSRYRNICEARQMFCHLARKHTTETTSTIGEAINRNHSSVIYGSRSMRDLCLGSKRLRMVNAAIEKYMVDNLKPIVRIETCEHCNQPII